MFEFLEKFLQEQGFNFMRHPVFYVILGLAVSLVYLFRKDVRKNEIKMLAKELNLKFIPYGFKFDLFPSLSFLIKRYATFEPINIIEGFIQDKYAISFDFYYKNLNLLQDIGNSGERLITFINGRYFYNLDRESIKKTLLSGAYPDLEKIENKRDFLKLREIAIIDTYANLNLKGHNYELKIVEKVLQKFRDVKYSSLVHNLGVSWIGDDISYPSKEELNAIEKRIETSGIKVKYDDIETIIREYLDSFSIELKINI